MTSTIVTGVDSSQTAVSAAAKAAELADAFGADLHVITAYSANNTYSVRAPVDGSDTDGLAAAAREVAEAAAADLGKAHPSVTVTVSTGAGAPAEVLLNHADALGADLIVVGNKHVQGLSRILGSVAKKVASEANCDIHIVNTTSSQ